MNVVCMAWVCDEYNTNPFEEIGRISRSIQVSAISKEAGARLKYDRWPENPMSDSSSSEIKNKNET